MLKILFRLRRHSETKATLYCRITLNGKRATDFSTGITCHPDEWNSRQQQLRGRKNHFKNEQLHEIRDGIRTTLFRLEYKQGEVTANELKDEFRRPEEQKEVTLLALCKEFVESESVSKSPNTIKNYKKYERKLVEYLDRGDILVSQINIKWGEKYRQHLLKKDYSTNYASRCLKFVKQVLRFGVRNEDIQQNPLSQLPVPTEQKPIIFLTENELRAIETRKFQVQRLENVRQVFLFQCYTGLAYTDLRRLSKEHFIQQNEQLWIQIERKKVKGAIALIPITPAAKKILERYDYQVPVLSNQRYNAYLKEIADICQIKKNLTTHVARRTCGMYLLNRGISMEVVAKVLGHKSIKTTEKTYAQVLNIRVQEEFAKAGLCNLGASPR